MTKEEAREILTHNWTRVDNPNYSDSELDEAFFMAIESLKAEPIRCKECEIKAYTEKLVDAFIEDGEELADSVKVVRCKDCRWQKISRKSGLANCGHELGMMRADDNNFCSYGERREP